MIETTATNYVAAAAEALHAALRSLGKDPAKSLTPDLERQYVQLVLTLGERTTLEAVHDAWAVARSIERPDHPDLVPFGQLSPKVVEYDRPYAEAIRAAARELAGRDGDTTHG